jgi:positive regulator of sigma E activity
LAAVGIVNRTGVRASFLLLIYTLIVILVGPGPLVCWVLGLREPLMAIGRWAMLNVGFVSVDRKGESGGKKSIEKAARLLCIVIKLCLNYNT